jgi:hypothetical protein
MELLDIVNGFYSIRRSQHHFRLKRLLGSSGMVRSNKFEIRELRWLERFEWSRLYRILATCCTVGMEMSLWSVSFEMYVEGGFGNFSNAFGLECLNFLYI